MRLILVVEDMVVENIVVKNRKENFLYFKNLPLKQHVAVLVASGQIIVAFQNVK
jgi:hypothetical protein